MRYKNANDSLVFEDTGDERDPLSIVLDNVCFQNSSAILQMLQPPHTPPHHPTFKRVFVPEHYEFYILGT